jgi:hypothetical protein
LQDSLEIPQYIVVPETQNSEASAPQIPRPLNVLGALRLNTVASPIELDNESRLLANEIDDIGAHRPLAAELRTGQPSAAQTTPKRQLRIR